MSFGWLYFEFIVFGLLVGFVGWLVCCGCLGFVVLLCSFHFFFFYIVITKLLVGGDWMGFVVCCV